MKLTSHHGMIKVMHLVKRTGCVEMQTEKQERIYIPLIISH